MHLSLLLASLTLVPATRTTALAFARAVVAGNYQEAAHMIDYPSDPKQRDQAYTILSLELRELAHAFALRGPPIVSAEPKGEQTGLQVSATPHPEQRDTAGEQREFVTTGSAHGPCAFSFAFSPAGKLVVVTLGVAKDDALQAQIVRALTQALERDAGAKVER